MSKSKEARGSLGLPSDYTALEAQSKEIQVEEDPELKHGSLVWKPAFENDVQGQLLCKSEVNRYILALGEIYIVGVLGASIELYKPWILTSSADVSDNSVLLDECSVFWSSSGL
ncbi:hypothetical protein SAY86_012291 [Trapa natans]|uniref:Synergin gamma C-terminal domain-containing protein n=1 Tax=Trapa natans TaxID=22666 RepID=A0AAN7R933_TRANT|nr:hypothetical protein SAY86_012291 [Trapa natans]